jgi:hypothetical protein
MYNSARQISFCGGLPRLSMNGEYREVPIIPDARVAALEAL